jgi:hypothetical protein
MMDSIISACALKDLEVWRQSSKRIIQFIPAKNYILIVPEAELDIFKKASPANYSVINENDVLGALSLKQIRDMLPDEYKFRAGWYLQQILKIAVANNLEGKNGHSLIWDADTVPLKHINFLSGENKLQFFMGNEFHEPYFSTIKKLLGLDKLVDQSFIAQSLPFRHEWIRRFIKSIEDRHEEPWVNAVMNCSALNNISGFSEYESIGTFVAKNFSEEMSFNDGRWERRGTQIFKSKNISFSFLDLFANANPNLNFISFEGWDS